MNAALLGGDAEVAAADLEVDVVLLPGGHDVMAFRGAEE